MRDYERRNANRKTVLSAIESKLKASPAVRPLASVPMSGTEHSAARPRTGDELELTIDRLAHGGAGVARLDGYVVFVRGAVPGDRVRARMTKSKRSFAEADSVELLEPTPDRVEPVAPHPGAPWQVLPYERQLQEKEDQVRDALERIGALRVAARRADRARRGAAALPQQARVLVRRGRATGELVLGFHRPGRFDLIDDVTADILASERVDELREAVKAWCRDEGLSRLGPARPAGPAAQPRRARGPPHRAAAGAHRDEPRRRSFGVDELAAATLRRQLPVDARRRASPRPPSGGATEVVKGEAQPRGGAVRPAPAISPDAFFQTNTEMAERLYGSAAELAGLTGRERVLDLFCGIGTIALVTRAGRRRGVGRGDRRGGRGRRDRERALQRRRQREASSRATCALAMRPLLEQSGQPDVVVVDPPRAGLSQKIVRRILEAEAQRIVYVSCNPTTLAPNARQIVDAGYELKTVRPVDMFPQTPHIECVALLERRLARRSGVLVERDLLVRVHRAQERAVASPARP